MKGIKLTICGDPKSKKNSMQIIPGKAGSRPRLIQSKIYREYAEDFKNQVPAEAKLNIDYPVQVQTIFFRATKRRVDLINLIAAAHDLLVDSGVLADDNAKIIISVDGSRVCYDKENPRTEITILPVACQIAEEFLASKEGQKFS